MMMRKRKKKREEEHNGRALAHGCIIGGPHGGRRVIPPFLVNPPCGYRLIFEAPLTRTTYFLDLWTRRERKREREEEIRI